MLASSFSSFIELNKNRRQKSDTSDRGYIDKILVDDDYYEHDENHIFKDDEENDEDTYVEDFIEDGTENEEYAENIVQNSSYYSTDGTVGQNHPTRNGYEEITSTRTLVNIVSRNKCSGPVDSDIDFNSSSDDEDINNDTASDDEDVYNDGCDGNGIVHNTDFDEDEYDDEVFKQIENRKKGIADHPRKSTNTGTYLRTTLLTNEKSREDNKNSNNIANSEKNTKTVKLNNNKVSDNGQSKDYPNSKKSESMSARKKYSSLRTLPTLEEIADDDSTFSFAYSSSLPSVNNIDRCNEDCTSPLRIHRNLSLKTETLLNNITASRSVLSASTGKKKRRSKKPTRMEKIREMQSVASELAQRGDEDGALKVYRQALQMAGTEMERIQVLINKGKNVNPSYKSKHSSNSSPLPVAAIKSIQNRIQEDLLTMSERIGKIRIVMTIIHERIGEFDKALECCKEATEVYTHQQLLLRGSDLQSSNKAIDENDDKLKLYKETKNRLKETKRMKIRLVLGKKCAEDRARAFEEMTALRNEMSQLRTSNGRQRFEIQQNVLKIAENQLESEKNSLGKSHPQIVDGLLQVTSLLMESSSNMEYDKAITLLNDALRICKTALGLKHPKTASVYLKLAHIHRVVHEMNGRTRNLDVKNKDFENGASDHEELSLQNFMSATETLRASQLHPTLLGSTLNDVAIIYMKRRDFKKAIELLKDALKQYEASTESLTTSVAIDLAANSPTDTDTSLVCTSSSDSPVWVQNKSTGQDGEETTAPSSMGSSSSRGNNGMIHHGNLSIDALQVWRNLGECYYQVEQYDDAKDAFANALEIQRSTRMIHDAVSELDLGIVGVQEGMLKLVDDPSIIDTLSRLGKACTAAEKHHDALFAHKESLELMNRIAVDEELYLNLTHQQVLVRRHLLSKTLLCIANACAEVLDYKEALKYYSESVQHSRLGAAASAAAETVTDNPTERRRLQNERLVNAAHCGTCFAGIANCHLKQGKFTEALKVCNDALKYCEKKGMWRVVCGWMINYV